jgi:hypothetical protein
MLNIYSRFITEGISVHIDADSQALIPGKSEHVPHPGFENEYMIGLDVFHQLHCLVSCPVPCMSGHA